MQELINKIHHADCLEFMANLPDKCIDHIITDPPFEAEAHTQQRRVTRNGELSSEPLSFEAITEDLRLGVALQGVRICRGWFIAFCQAEAVDKWRITLEEAGAKYKRAMVWIKPDGMPQYSGDRPGMGYESMVAAWCGEGGSKWNGGGQHGVFTYPKNEQDRFHETQKPQPLIKKLVTLFSDAGETLLDPFSGSASLAIAAYDLERNFICVEKDADYHAASVARLNKHRRQGNLFAPPSQKEYEEAVQQDFLKFMANETP